MSDRNLGLFLPGHVPAADVLAALESAPDKALLAAGDPHIGHGERDGRRYTHVGLPCFEELGFLLLGQTALPGSDDLEMHLGRTLSAAHGVALMLQYDDETGWGGSARFEDGSLADRHAADGREMDAVRRRLDGEEILDDLDPSDWIWPWISEAVEAGAESLFGEGVRTDDDIAALIAGAKAAEGAAGGAPPLRSSGQRAPNPAGPQVRVQDAGDPGRLQRLLHRLIRRK